MSLKTIKNKFLIFGTVVSTIVYLAWRILFTIPYEYGTIALIASFILLVVEILGMFEAAIHYYSMANIEDPERPVVDENLFPDVDVFIATYNEPKELLYKTINGCNNMDYPDKSKVHIYLCDDGNRAEIKELAESMKINYLTRADRKDAKAGNLNNALANSTSPLIVTFDADMIPMHDFLKVCVPYFLTEEKVGFVQTPQNFYNPDLFQFNLFSENRIPNEQDYFYRDIQVSKNKTNSVIYGGSNTMILREALKDAGGFYTKVITEDFATGMIIQSKGYKCYAIDEIHASGLSPSDLKSLVKQRERWARGCIQTGRKLNILFRKGLGLTQKLSYISAISYWYSGIKRLVYIMSPILFSVFGIVVVNCTLIEVLMFWLPMYLFSNASLKQLSKNIRTTKWTNVYETILFPSLIIPVVLETFGVSQNKFVVTRKDGAKNDKAYQIKKSIPHVFLAIVSVIGIMNCIRMIFGSGSPTYIVVLFWLISNLYNIIMAIFFMLGRKVYRSCERFMAKVDCIISYDDINLECKTTDISESGLAISLDFPEYIPSHKEITITLYTERYFCKIQGQVVHVEEVNEKWRYAFRVTQVDKENLNQLLNIVYDRIPSLPRNLDKNSSIYDDIRVNVLTRNKKVISLNRRLARINLDKTINSKDISAKLVNFNYQYIVFEMESSSEVVKIKINKDITLNCEFERELIYNANTSKNKKVEVSKQVLRLYSVKEYENIYSNDKLKQVLHIWINEYRINKLKKRSNNTISNDFDEMASL